MSRSRTIVVTGGAGFIGSRFVAHHLRTKPADRVIVLDRGRILAQGAPDAIRADPRVREAYLGSESA